MPSLKRLTGMLEFGLTEFPDTPPHALARNITSVRPVRPGDRPRASGDLSTTLAIADLDHWAPTDPDFEELVSRTAEAGVAALAVVSTAGRVPAGLADALRHLRVPLLTLPTTTSWADLADAVTRECVIDLRHGAEWRDWLLGQARPAPDVRRSGRIVRWLATETGGRVVLIGRDGAVVAMAPQRSAGKLAPVADKIQEIAAGRIESAALESDGAEVRLVAVGSTRPRAVLAVVREPPFDRHLLTQVTNRTADLLSLHLAVEDADAAIQNQQSAERELRVAILELLMTGEVLKARRTAAPVYPGLLDAAAARVYILEAPPSERDRLYDECRRAVDRLSLVVQCPIYEEHLVVIAPQPCTVTDTDDEMDTALRRLVALRPDRYLGASGLRLIAETDQSHRHALRALARARIDRTRTAYYSSQGRLPELLNRLYPGWATAVLHPLLRQAQADRDMLLQTLTLTLQSSVRAAAELTGVHRNTVANRVRAAATILGVDLEALRDRAVVAAALEALFLDEYVDEGTHAGPADLQDYLAHPEAQAWGQDFLQVLTEELVDTLKAWVLADGDTARMAGALGIHAQTVRKRLRIASRFLQRDLLGQSADAYDVVLAIAGEFNIPLPLSR